MPDMDGPTLLGIVQRGSGKTGRIILTSETRTAELAAALLVAHQVLTKPCTAAALRGAIERLLTELPTGGDSGDPDLLDEPTSGFDGSSEES
jgi:CheY-like chemotaxis protein